MENNNGKVCWICAKWFSNGKAIGGHMRSHYVKSAIPPKHDFSANSTRGDGSEPYPQSPTRKRSKCHRKLNAVADTQAAEALRLLSEGEPKSGRGDSLAQADSQTRFKCDRCGKMFQSYQALGGHKASHSKTKNLGQGGGYPHSC